MRNENRIIELLQERYPDARIEVKDVIKTNATKRGIIIMTKDTNVAPTIYYEDFKGTDEEVAEQVIRLYEENKTSSFDVESLKKNAKDNVIAVLVNKQRNAQLLNNCPYIDFLDFAVIFKLKVNALSNSDVNATIQITNDVVKKFDLENEDLLELAKKNMETPVVCDLMEKLMGMGGNDILGLNEEDVKRLENEMMFVSNPKGYFGAIAITQQEVIDKLAELFGDFIMLPSSVHECLVVKKTPNVDLNSMSEMVKAVNEESLAEDEILGDKAYLYNAETKEWTYA